LTHFFFLGGLVDFTYLLIALIVAIVTTFRTRSIAGPGGFNLSMLAINAAIPLVLSVGQLS